MCSKSINPNHKFSVDEIGDLKKLEVWTKRNKKKYNSLFPIGCKISNNIEYIYDLKNKRINLIVNKKIKAAVIGLGVVHHARTLYAYNNCDLVWLCDKDKHKLSR